jgi:hypothetical protein
MLLVNGVKDFFFFKNEGQLRFPLREALSRNASVNGAMDVTAEIFSYDSSSNMLMVVSISFQ